VSDLAYLDWPFFEPRHAALARELDAWAGEHVIDAHGKDVDAECRALVRSLGGTPEVGRVSGGGARSRLWLQICASVLELPLERVAVDEGAAYGAALLGGVAAGHWPDPAGAVEACVQVHSTVDPVPDWVAAYVDVRERFEALYPAVRPFSD